MRRTFVLAALLLSPLLATAQAEAPPPASAATAPAQPADASPPQWSFGGGVAYIIFSGGALALYSSDTLNVPSASASLERRLSDRTWVIAGLNGSVQRDRMDVPAGSWGYTRNDARLLSVVGGVRRVLARPGAKVEFSLVALGEAGVGDADRREISYSATSVSTDLTSWFVGANAGFALDRELGDGLSFRIASPLVGASYEWSMVDRAGEPRQLGSAFRVYAYLAPRLELRLAF